MYFRTIGAFVVQRVADTRFVLHLTFVVRAQSNSTARFARTHCLPARRAHCGCRRRPSRLASQLCGGRHHGFDLEDRVGGSVWGGAVLTFGDIEEVGFIAPVVNTVVGSG